MVGDLELLSMLISSLVYQHVYIELTACQVSRSGWRKILFIWECPPPLHGQASLVDWHVPFGLHIWRGSGCQVPGVGEFVGVAGMAVNISIRRSCVRICLLYNWRG